MDWGDSSEELIFLNVNEKTTACCFDQVVDLDESVLARLVPAVSLSHGDG
jgi:hypothetical protein